VTYNYSPLYGKQVLDVAVYGQVMNEGTTTSFTGSVNTWKSGCSGYSCVGTKLGSWTVDSDGTSNTQDLGQQIYDWVQAEDSHTLYLRGAETAGSYTYKWMETVLAVSYRNRVTFSTESGVIAVTPDYGAHTTTQPIITAIVQDESGMAGVSYRYRISTQTGSGNTDYATFDLEANKVWDSGWVSDPDLQIPASVNLKKKDLPTTSGQYYYTVELRDGYSADELNDAGDPEWETRYYGDNYVKRSKIRDIIVDVEFPAQPSGVPIGTAPEQKPYPLEGDTVTSLTPTIKVPAVAGVTSPYYEFTVATSGNDLEGQVATSGWIDTPQWTLPSGVLQDGGSYTWSARLRSGTTGVYPNYAFFNDFKVDLRLGTTGPSPYDTAGPVTVNLANGNVALSFASPTVSTVGGSMGMTFSYNSQDRGVAGLGVVLQRVEHPVIDPVVRSPAGRRCSCGWSRRSTTCGRTRMPMGT
jgi:hypothetical protein